MTDPAAKLDRLYAWSNLKLQEYRFRTETPQDAAAILTALTQEVVIAEFQMVASDVDFPDRECHLVTNAIPETLERIISSCNDSHVAAQTLKTAAEYDGERNSPYWQK